MPCWGLHSWCAPVWTSACGAGSTGSCSGLDGMHPCTMHLASITHASVLLCGVLSWLQCLPSSRAADHPVLWIPEGAIPTGAPA